MTIIKKTWFSTFILLSSSLALADFKGYLPVDTLTLNSAISVYLPENENKNGHVLVSVPVSHMGAYVKETEVKPITKEEVTALFPKFPVKDFNEKYVFSRIQGYLVVIPKSIIPEVTPDTSKSKKKTAFSRLFRKNNSKVEHENDEPIQPKNPDVSDLIGKYNPVESILRKSKLCNNKLDLMELLQEGPPNVTQDYRLTYKNHESNLLVLQGWRGRMRDPFPVHRIDSRGQDCKENERFSPEKSLKPTLKGLEPVLRKSLNSEASDSTSDSTDSSSE